MLADIYRANLVVIFGWACAFGVGPFIIIAALVLHHAAYGFAPVIAMVGLSMLGSAAVDGLRVRLHLQSRRLTNGIDAPNHFADQPPGFWLRNGFQGLISIAKAAGGVFLAYIALTLVHPLS